MVFKDSVCSQAAAHGTDQAECDTSEYSVKQVQAVDQGMGKAAALEAIANDSWM
jgi:hypothetical protein